MSVRLFATVLVCLAAAPAAYAEDHVLCNTTAIPPFTVKSGAPITIEWIMADTAMENGVNVPNRYDGFYVQIDSGPKEDIGKATALAACSNASQKPGDVPYTYKTKNGVTRGSHNLHLSAWSFTLDGAGNPTTNRQESAVTITPFSAGDPVMSGPPISPVNIAIGQ